MGSDLRKLDTWAPRTCPSAPSRCPSGCSLGKSGSADAPSPLGRGPSSHSSRGSQKSKGCGGYWGRWSRRPRGPGGREAGRARSRRPHGSACLGLILPVHPAPEEDPDGSAPQLRSHHAAGWDQIPAPRCPLPSTATHGCATPSLAWFPGLPTPPLTSRSAHLSPRVPPSPCPQG